MAQRVKNLAATQETQETGVQSPGQGGSPWQPAPVFLPGESHGQRSRRELDMTEHTAHVQLVGR